MNHYRDRLTHADMKRIARDMWYPYKIKEWRKVGNNTCRYVVRLPCGNYFDVIQLWRTPVLIRFPQTFDMPERWQINIGGYPTVTTRARINRFLPYPFGIYQRNHAQIVSNGRDAREIAECAVVEPETGTITAVW